MKTLKKAGLIGRAFASGYLSAQSNPTVIGLAVISGVMKYTKEESILDGIVEVSKNMVLSGIGGGVLNVITKAGTIKEGFEIIDNDETTTVIVEEEA